MKNTEPSKLINIDRMNRKLVCKACKFTVYTFFTIFECPHCKQPMTTVVKSALTGNELA